MTFDVFPVDPHKSTRDHLSWPVLIGALLVTVLGAVLIAAQPKPGAPVAVFFAPSTPLATIYDRVGQASGDVVDFGRVPGLVIAIGQDPDFLARLRAAGGLLLLDGSLTNAICLTDNQKVS